MVLLLTALGFVAWRRTGNEPTYQGRKLSDWLDDAAYADPYSFLARAKAGQAIQQIGTNAVPYLLGLLESPFTDMDGSLVQWIKRQPWISDRTKDSLGDQSFRRWRQAEEGFSALGPKASPAAYKLIYLAGVQSVGLGSAPLHAIEKIGPGAVDPMIQSLTNTDRTAAGIPAMKLGAIFGLRMLRLERAVPNLLDCLDDSDARTREESIQTLALIKPPQEAVVKRLIRALHDPEVAVSRAAARALGGFGSPAASAIPDLRQLRRTEPLRSELDEAIAKIEGAIIAPP